MMFHGKIQWKDLVETPRGPAGCFHMRQCGVGPFKGVFLGYD